MEVNKKLRDYVEKKGIKQSFLSEKTGISADAISRILRLERKISAEEFLRICFALNEDPRTFAPAA